MQVAGIAKDLPDFTPLQSISMRKRLALYMITWLISVISVLFLLLSVFGVLNPASSDLQDQLSRQLDYTQNQIYHDMDELAAYAVQFSEKMSREIAESPTSFANLRNNIPALTTLQQDTYDTVLTYLQLADCSGAFYILNTTANDTLDDVSYSGIYLKYANVGSDTLFHNSVCMFRGISSVARENDINLFSTWECELKAGVFPEMDAILEQSQTDPVYGYMLTKAYKLPDAWEKVRLLCAPITDQNGEIIGVCGFEISDPFFQSTYQVADYTQHFITCALLDSHDNLYSGQFASNQSGYSPPLQNPFIVHVAEPLSIFSDGTTTMIGKIIPLQIGAKEHNVAVMLPQSLYDECMRTSKAKTVAIFLVIAILGILSSIWLSRRYVRPLLKSMEQIKSKQFDTEAGIPEIDDLFAFLAEYDHMQEIAIAHAEREKADALSAIEQMQQKYAEASQQLERLTYSRKAEIDPDDYANFKKGLATLTNKEREIFDLYLSGKTAKEILSIIGIQESTLKFHNHNMLGKLGVSSRKQMLRYAALVEKEAKEANEQQIEQ